MLQKLACALALLPAFWLASAQALGLGEIDVRSKLNQRFVATIPVLAADSAEIETLTIRLGSVDDFAHAGIERSDYLSSLEFAVTPGTPGQIRVTSAQTAREPFLNFIVEARWSGGRLLREYTVLLDPPTNAPEPAAPVLPVPKPVESAPVATPEPAAPKPASAPTAPPQLPPKKAPATAVAQAPAPAVERTGSYGPVQANETLWGIAGKLRANTGVTMDQMMLALYEGNPGAFEGGINRLLKGSRLAVPSDTQIRSVDTATAKARVDELRGTGKSPTTPNIPAPIEPMKPAPVVAPPAPSVVTPPPAAAIPPPAAPPKNAAPPTPAPLPAPAAAPPVPKPGPAAAETPKSETPKSETPPAETAPAAPTGSAQPAAPPVAAQVTPPVTAVPAPLPAPAGEQSFIEQNKWPLLGALLVLIVALFGVSAAKRRRDAKAEAEMARTPPKAMLGPIDMPPMAGSMTSRSGSLRDSSQAEPDDRAADNATAVAAGAAAAAAAAAADEKSPGSGARHSDESEFGQALGTEARTLAVNLDANDPLTEADFHLAYGLYYEAAQMLKQAAVKDPERVELRTKLAETYFAAGKPMEFQEVAEGLHNQLTSGDWQTIAEMGRKLCPDSSLFADAGPDVAIAPGAAVGRDKTEVNLVDFDLAVDPSHAKSHEPPSPAEAGGFGEIDLKSFDLGSDASGKHGDELSAVDFNLDELDLGKQEHEENGIGGGDEIDTKLDLARAYADMGDNEAARNLLAEVTQGGTDKQKQEAEALTQRLVA